MRPKLAAIMVGVSRGWLLLLSLIGIVVAGCGGDGADPTTSLPPGATVPESLDGFWLLTETDLTLDIDLETAAVDGRTSCARLLGSITFLDGGDVASFSLPGRDDSRCDADATAETDRLVELMSSVQRADAEPGGYLLFDIEGEELGRLQSGG